MTVTNEEGLSSEPDEVIITINPVNTPPPPNEDPKTTGDFIKGIIQNPLNVTNSIDAANQIKNLLSYNNPRNDRLVCNLLDELGKEQMYNVGNLLNC